MRLVYIHVGIYTYEVLNIDINNLIGLILFLEMGVWDVGAIRGL